MPKTRRSAVTENAKNSQVRSPGNMQKNFHVRGQNTIFKMHRSGLMQKSQKLAGPWSRKIPKTRRSTVTENAKNLQVCCHGKCQKLGGPRSRKMPKTSRSAVTKLCQKLPGLRSQKMKKMHRSGFTQKCQKLSGPRSRKMPTT